MSFILQMTLPPTRVIAFDPGGSTGWVLCSGKQLIMHGTLQPNEVREMAANGGTSQLFSVIVAENYRLYPWKAHDQGFSEVIPARVIGMLDVMSHRLKLPLALQSAADAKVMITNEVLKDLGWYKELTTDHEKDAARHALLYLVRTTLTAGR